MFYKGFLIFEMGTTRKRCSVVVEGSKKWCVYSDSWKNPMQKFKNLLQTLPTDGAVR